MVLKRIALTGTATVPVTGPNSGASRVIASGGSSVVYDDAYGAKLITVAGQPTVIDLDLNADNKIFTFSAEIRTPLDTPASGSFPMLQILTASGALCLEIGYSSAQKIVLGGPGGVYAVLSKTGSSADGTIANNTSFRITGIVEIGSATNNGKFSCRLFTPGSSTPLFTPNAMTTLNLSTTEANRLRLGNGSFGSGRTYGGRYLQVNDGGTTELPEWIPASQLADPTGVVLTPIKPTGVSLTDGKIRVEWSAVPNADHYAVRWAPGLGATTGFTVVEPATSGIELTGKAPGNYTVQVIAKAS